MTITISRSLLEKMIKTNIEHNEIMTQILSSLDQSEEWVDTSTAEVITGIPAARIRYLYRSGQIDGRRHGQKKIQVRYKDLETYINKEVANA